uniref:Isoleucine--tRNA ligase n=1 Tax=candidate division WOR-3 bacterium TaxID=2052148 RepID=A0A7C3Z0X9_UNCW3
MPYQPLPSKPDWVERERRILQFWEEKKVFKKLLEKNRGKKKFSFLDGPITANNPMGVHHAWGRTYKDLFQRYKAMKGFDQRYQNGFDCQGLWVEVEVEKELGFKSKKDIERYGIERFVEKCKERVRKYSLIQTQQSIRLGQWMDWENSYYTMSDENNYHIWYFLKRCHEHGWIYKGEDVVPWCPRCGTAISQHEIVTEGYRELVHKGLYLRFPLAEEVNTYLLVWTTTPWTLTANVACAVHPEMTYVKVRLDDKFYYLLEERLSALSLPDSAVVKRLKGKELTGQVYLSPFAYLPVQKGVTHRVITWEEVSAQEGTGIVHIAPGCGKEDFILGKEFSLPVIAPIDEDGNFLSGYDFLTGKNAKGAEGEIIEFLRGKGFLFKVEDYRHRYPVCWRCGEELLFRLVPEWYISMAELRERIMAVAKRIRWIPEFGLERELDWLRNMEDWLISKKRYWGLALPIWECTCGHWEVIGSKEELRERAISGWERFEGKTPHRPWVDYVKIRCAKCGGEVSRIPDVGNPWLDAGIVPFSTLNYLKDRRYWQEWFPFDFITESFPGQFRNWFYAILTMSTVLENREPVKTILGYALLKDEKGQDMHKSAGNVIWFDEAVEKISADVLRWIFVAHNPTENLLFGWKMAGEAKRQLLTLWNVYSFFFTYAAIDQFSPEREEVPLKERPPLDRWIISRLYGLIKTVNERLDDYDPHPVPKEILRFVDDLSLWYIRRSRRRFWKSENDRDKLSAYQTLYTCLLALTKILAPIMPFFAEDMYQRLVRDVLKTAPESVHLTDFPEAEEEMRDERLEEEMALVRKMVFLGRSLREIHKVKVRMPLPKGLFFLPKDKLSAIREYEDLLKEELNLKEVEFYAKEEENLSSYPKEYLAEEEETAVFLPCAVSPDLELEGLARELVRRVQILRKEAGFQVADRIFLYFATEGKLKRAIEKHRDYIANETLAVKIEEGEGEGNIQKELEIEGLKIKITLRLKDG